MSASIGVHTHVFEGPALRADVAPAALAERFGPFWWFEVCETCAQCRMCPAAGDLVRVCPQVPLDWERWRLEPELFERRPPACEIPPPGWWCSRVAGHDGPCAARPVVPDDDGQG